LQNLILRIQHRQHLMRIRSSLDLIMLGLHVIIALRIYNVLDLRYLLTLEVVNRVVCPVHVALWILIHDCRSFVASSPLSILSNIFSNSKLPISL
jgi:hypothetical protein